MIGVSLHCGDTTNIHCIVILSTGATESTEKVRGYELEMCCHNYAETYVSQKFIKPSKTVFFVLSIGT
jgi:hypothetical protein